MMGSKQAALCLFFVLFCLAAVIAIVAVTCAETIPKPVPRSDYPANTRSFKSEALGSRKYDCGWSFICDLGNLKIMHSLRSHCSILDVRFSEASPPDKLATCLGRVNGWYEEAVANPGNSRIMAFRMLGSNYDSGIDAAGSALDFVQTASNPRDAGFSLSKSQPNLLPGSDLGGAAVMVYKSGIPNGVNSYLVLAFDGTAEVEGSATWLSGSRMQRKALHWLEKQARDGLIHQLARP